MICPGCGRKVGAWHKSGVHPKCVGKRPNSMTVEMTTSGSVSFRTERASGLGANLSQKQRDEILRRINRPREL